MFEGLDGVVTASVISFTGVPMYDYFFMLVAIPALVAVGISIVIKLVKYV